MEEPHCFMMDFYNNLGTALNNQFVCTSDYRPDEGPVEMVWSGKKRVFVRFRGGLDEDLEAGVRFAKKQAKFIIAYGSGRSIF